MKNEVSAMRYGIKGWKTVVVMLFVVSISIYFASKFQIYRVTSRSMAPTLCDGDYMVSRRAENDIHDVPRVAPRHGTLPIVVFLRDGAPVVKRLVAASGDRVSFSKSQFLVDGQSVVLPCQQPAKIVDMRATIDRRVPPGHAFMLGDNFGASVDSRMYGSVPYRDIVGKVIFVLRIPKVDGVCECSAF